MVLASKWRLTYKKVCDNIETTLNTINMEGFSYILTPQAKKEIENIIQIRDKILLELIKPQDEIKLRWESVMERLMHAARLTGQSLKHDEAAKIILHEKYSGIEFTNELINYYKDINYIKYTWFLNDNRVDVSDLIKLKSLESLSRKDSEEIQKILEFVQISSDHPITQSVLVFAILSTIKGFINITNYISLLHLFLYKYGFDFRGLLDIEEYLLNDKEHFHKLIEDSKKEKNLTNLIEYIIQAISIQSEKAYFNLTKKQFKNYMPQSYFRLSDRQQQILTFFEKPEARITNRKVQKLFRVSQITASRDLSKLASLGLIIALGKGRSTYYSKI